jgi:ATP-dependent helicase/DNAse subunit B
MTTITFYLTPDKYAAHYVRKEFTKSTSLIGVQIGTWSELLELARNSFCLQQPKDDWQENIREHISSISNAFWNDSLRFDPEATTTIISQALSDLLWGTAPGQVITSDICKSLTERGERHITDLLRLHEKLDRALPSELALIQSLLNVNKTQAIRSIKIFYVNDILNLNIWQRSLINYLNDHAGTIESKGTCLKQFTNLISWTRTGQAETGLQWLQQNLFTQNQSQQSNQSGLQWLAARDYVQEAEVAAGMVQQIVKNQKVSIPEIALLLPESSDYTQAVTEIFSKAGIPLSGVTKIIHNRDHARELLYNFLLSREDCSTAPMLLASLFGSPLLPWYEQSAQLTQEIMDGKSRNQIVKSLPEDQQKTGYFIYSKQITSVKTLSKSLRGLIAILSKVDNHLEHRNSAMALVQELFDQLNKDEEINWESLFRICRPKLISQNEQEAINREGVRIFHPDREPWQAVQHLLVLGFADGNYPQMSNVHPVIPEEDRHLLGIQNICIPTRSSKIEHQRNRFIRQLCAVNTSITFLIPQMDSMGSPLKPSSSLGFMAQLFENIEEPEQLILDLSQAEDRKMVQNLAIATNAHPVPPKKLVSNDLEFHEDLLTKRKNHEGNTAPESPSGLEKMMVSPLAWLFSRYHIKSHEWSPEELDPLVMGSIAHNIFEALFTNDTPLPLEREIPAKVKSLFHIVIQKDFPFLTGEEWRVECKQMIRQYTEAADRWLDFLHTNNLEILGEETWLAGEFNNHPIHGKADLLCKTTDSQLLVIDYKTSKSKKRKESMEKGFDHQATLYCKMLDSGTVSDKTPNKVKKYLQSSPKTGALYYTLRDQVILGDEQTKSLIDVENTGTNISVNGLNKIRQQMKHLREGVVTLNTENDSVTFAKETSITPYALEDSPLISLFMKKEEDK